MKVLIALATTLVATATTAQTQQSASVKNLSFISGCWTTPKGVSPEIRECYTAPYAGLIQGSSQTVKDGQTTQVEFITIREKDGKIIYSPIFNGKALSTFTLARVDDRTAAFENPQNDFPKKIIYRRGVDRTLTIRLEDARADDPRNQEITLSPQGM